MSSKGWCQLWATLLVFVLLIDATYCAQRDPWQVLGVRRSATQKEITKAFRRLSRQWHPDKNPSKEATKKFQEISAAYDYLTDPIRQQKPWDFGTTGTGPGAAGRQAGGAQTTFDAFQNTFNIVLDLDPRRLWELLWGWIDQQLEINWDTVEPLWTGPVDRSVCRCLEAAWKLPQLLEPIMLAGAEYNVLSYKQGQWRTWGSSGILLELSFWVGRQTPCFRHHAHSHSSSASDGDFAASSAGEDGQTVTRDKELLVELQQQLLMQRKLRQQLKHAETRASSGGGSKNKSKRSSQDGDHGSSGHIVREDGFGLDSSQLQPDILKGSLLWWALLTTVAYLFTKDRQLLAASSLLTVVGLWYMLGSGATSEAAVEALAAALESNSWKGLLIGAWYVAACFSICLLLPLMVAGCAVLVATWLWAALSCASIATTPCISRTGFAVWILMQLWAATGGDFVRGGLVLAAVGYLVYLRPRLFLWWIQLLLSPTLFVYYLACLMIRSWGEWLGMLEPEKPKKANIQAAVQEQQQQQENATPARPGTAAAAAAVKRAKSPGNAGGVTATVNGAQAPNAGIANPATATANSSSSRKRQVGALFRGPWWPVSFGPADLAFTCYWYITLLGWELPCRVLTAAAISVKLSFALVALSLAVASFGAPISITVSWLVRIMLRGIGLAIGSIWVLYCTLDDVARWMDPVGYRKKQKQRAKHRQGKVGRVRRQQQRQQPAEAGSLGDGLNSSVD